MIAREKYNYFYDKLYFPEEISFMIRRIRLSSFKLLNKAYNQNDILFDTYNQCGTYMLNISTLLLLMQNRMFIC